MRERIIQIIDATTTPHKKYKELEEWTGISADSWRKVTNGKQRPTAEMIEGLGKQFPHYAEWLLTGTTTFHRQQDPTQPTPTHTGLIDLSLLDQVDAPPIDAADRSPLTPEEIEALVDAFFGQLATRRRKTNGNQEG